MAAVASPAVQMRVMLAHLRQSGTPFDRAWALAWERVRWPHDTTHRLEWKALLGDLDAAERIDMPRRDVVAQMEAWQAAYEQMPVTELEVPLGHLLAAAA